MIVNSNWIITLTVSQFVFHFYQEYGMTETTTAVTIVPPDGNEEQKERKLRNSLSRNYSENSKRGNWRKCYTKRFTW